MIERRNRILLVEPDPELLEILVAALSRRFDAQITCVSDSEACLEVDLLEPHDLVIAELDLENTDGIELADQLHSISARPFILLTDDPNRDDLQQAMRIGVRDLFIKPFPVTELLSSVERLLHGWEVRRQHQAKYRRMRELVRRVLRERRQLNQRVELVCRDLVGAHRRLVHRVIEGREEAARRSS